MGVMMAVDVDVDVDVAVAVAVDVDVAVGRTLERVRCMGDAEREGAADLDSCSLLIPLRVVRVGDDVMISIGVTDSVLM